MKFAVFFMPVAEVENGAEKEPEKNLKGCGERWYFCGGEMNDDKILYT